jgi:two-component sensor histidine kinase/putative methionine-R-sulfoxide reductase with GAF domain
VPVDDVVNETLLREAVRELSPHARNLIVQSLDEAIPAAIGMSRRLLQALAAALTQPDPAQSTALLRAEGRRWAEEDRSAAVLAEEAIQAMRILAARLRPLLAGEPDQSEGVRLAFLSEVLAGYVQAREEVAAQRRATELSARMKELAALHKVISAANSSLDLDATLHLVVRTVAEVMQVDVCELYLFEPERGTLVLGASVGLNPEAEGRLRLHLGDGVTGWAAQQGRPVAVADVRQEPRFLYEPLLHEDPYRSLLSVPIILYTVEELVGVINLRTRDVRTYTPEEVKFLETVAGEMAISLENVRLYQETDERLRQKVVELTTLQRVSAMVASTLELDQTLGLIAEQAAKLGRADMAAIVEWGPTDHEPSVVARWGLSPETAAHLQQWLRHGEVYAQIAAAGRAVTMHADDTTEAGRQAEEAGLHLLLCIPLRGKEGLLGTIGLRTERAEGFTPEQIDLLTVFADQAALAIENARLYGELRHSLETKSTLLQEMHHRVRNNLQAVASLLNMQMRRESSPQVARSLEESASRIQSIAVVHDLLCQENLGVTTVQAVARQVLEVSRSHLARPGLDLQCQIIDELPLPIGSKEATLLALLVNELFSNAIAHGLAGRERGTVVVDTYLADDRVVLQVKDDGQGPLPEENGSEGGLGLQIVRALVTRDLGGTFALQRDGEWTVAIVSFPYRAPHEIDNGAVLPAGLRSP